MAIQLPGAQPALPPAYTKQQILDKLAYWREHHLAHQAGTNLVTTRAEVTSQLDKWLDELLSLRGR